MLDPYWLEAAEFVRRRLDRSRTVIGPRELMSALPEITPYESCALHLLERPCHFILHKGMAGQIHQQFLYTAILTGELVFGNEVFLVLEIRGAGSADHMRHAKSFIETLAHRRTEATPVATPTRRPSCYLGNSRAICTTVHGHKMVVNTADVSLTPHLLTDGYWEDWVTAFVRRTVQPGWRVVEVGANIGYFTLLLAEGVGPGGSVVSFEANPHLCDILRMNVEINGFRDRATIVSAVVSEASHAEVDFKVYGRHHADSSLFATPERAEAFYDELYAVGVESISLDDYLGSDHPVDFIKVDAEGAEPLILQGAGRLLKANRSIRLVVELNPAAIQAAMDPRDFLESLRSLGFEVYRIDEDGQPRQKDLVELTSRSHSELYLERPT